MMTSRFTCSRARPHHRALLLALLGLLILTNSATAQYSRSSTKSSNSYRTNYQRVASGSQSNSTFEIRNGTLWAWGRNNFGQLSTGNTVDQSSPVQVGSETDWVSVAAGGNHTLGLKSNGTLWAWGFNGNGQLGIGNTANQSSPVQVGSETNWVSLTAGTYYTMGLKSNGTLWAWGFNATGQLGIGSTTQQTSPVQVGTDSKWVGVAAGASHTLGLKSDGTLWAWGFNALGQLGLGTTTNQSSPVQVGSETNWVSVAAGGFHSLSMKSDGTLWAWGFNSSGQLGTGTTTDQASPVQVGSETSWVGLAGGANHTLGLKSNGTLWAWGYNNSGQLGTGNTADQSSPMQVGNETNWVSVAVGSNHTLGLKSDGRLRAWGSNSNGQLGIGNTANQSSPVATTTQLVGWLSVAGGTTHTLGLKSDGTLWAWGDNSNGQLGIGNKTDQTSPRQVGSDTKWVSVMAGYLYTIGLKSDGTLWAWGDNDSKQLGIGSNATDQSSPVQVGSDTRWVSITTGVSHTLGLKSDGTLWAWGDNLAGQLGLGNINGPGIPVQVGSDTKWVSVAAGLYHTLALKSDGMLWAWGYNYKGQLGLGSSITQQTTPVQVGSETKWVSIRAGVLHSLGLKSDGTLWAWGLNDKGQLGLGNTTDQFSPVQVGSETNWVGVAPGDMHTLGLQSNGLLFTWGDNSFGQLGIGSANRTSPVGIFLSSPIVGLARELATANHSAVIGVSRQTICVTGNNNDGQLGTGNTNQLNSFNCAAVSLPVTLRYFTGRMTPAGALLGWATAREDNNARFHIERSRDGGAFESIGNVPSQAEGGNSFTELTYTFTDTQPMPGLNYYRLAQTDRAGSRTVASRLIALSREDLGSVLFPNPVAASGEASLEPALAYTSYQLSDVLGRVVQRADGPGVLSRVSLLGLPAGLYLLRVETAGGMQTFRVLR